MTALALPSPAGTPRSAVVRLHLTQWKSLAITPPAIVLVVAAISGVIALVFYRLGSEPGSEGWIAGSQGNPALFWALPGFLGWLGVQTVSLTFPLALSLGSTRRAFVAGTVVTHVLIAAYVTATLLLVLAAELLTDQWFVGLYVANVAILGLGDPLSLVLIAFLSSLLVLATGGAMAAAWVRHGPIGPTALALGTALVLGVIAVLVLPPIMEGALTDGRFALGVVVDGFWPGWLAVGALVWIALAIAAQVILLRRATVR